jgi:predicted TIM-barrel fold metal-dependent hydrolase
VNFPAPRDEITPFEDPAWEPFWAACVDLDMTLANHGAGGATTPHTTGPAANYIYMAESGAVQRLSPLVRLVLSGVFERHPEIKLVQTERAGEWYGPVLIDLDSLWERFNYALRELCPKPPSEYCRDSYFVGASFQAHFEAEAAVRDWYTENILWGSDYPHPEGTYHFQEDEAATPMTRIAMRSTYAGLPSDATTAMLGENAVRVYGLDGGALQTVADRIGAPTLDELAQPVEERPDHWGMAFRTTATYT